MTTIDPRGITLVEVLFATVLFALIAAHCLPLFVDAARMTEKHAHRDLPTSLLEELADQVVATPEAFGIANFATTGTYEIQTSRDPGPRRVVVVQVHPREDSIPPHAWITLQGGTSLSIRWLSLPEGSTQ